MHAFDSKDKLKKYGSAEEMIDDYYPVRYEFYETRKKYQIDALTKELVVLSNKAKYIKELLDDTLDLRKLKKDVIIKLLEGKQYDKLENDDEYKYLLKMPMDSVTDENVERLMSETKHKEKELEYLSAKSINQIWNEELDALSNEYTKYNHAQSVVEKKGDKKKSTKINKTTKKSAVTLLIDDE
jgi:DNA topoisomerase-2